MPVAVLQSAGQVTEVSDVAGTSQLLLHLPLVFAIVTFGHLGTTEPASTMLSRQRQHSYESRVWVRHVTDLVEEHGEHGHAVGLAELLHPASEVAVDHLVVHHVLTDPRAERAGTPRAVLVLLGQVVFEEQLTA